MEVQTRTLYLACYLNIKIWTSIDKKRDEQYQHMQDLSICQIPNYEDASFLS